MTEIQIGLMLWAGLIGLGCWGIGIGDYVYRLGLPRSSRSKLYDRIDNAFTTVGSLCVAGFVFGLYLLLAEGVR